MEIDLRATAFDAMAFDATAFDATAGWHFAAAHDRQRRSDCPGGEGRYGFNSYSLLTSMVLGFNAVSNIIANVNNNDNNNNDNNNQNDFSNIAGTSQDVSSMANSMTMVIVIVPPVGPPIPVIVGRALADGTVALDERFDRDGVFFQDENDGAKIYPNGTIIYRNSTRVDGDVVFGAVDARNPRAILDLRTFVDVNEALSIDTLRRLSRAHRLARLQPRSGGRRQRRDLYFDMLDSYSEILRRSKIEKYKRCESDFVCLVKRLTPFLWPRENCTITEPECIS